MKRIVAVFMSMLLGFLAILPVKAQELEEGRLYAKAALLMDGENGRVLFGKNEEETMPMASTTKIMTCIVALENGNLEDEVTISAYAASMPKVHLGIRKGETYYLKDLLYSLMLESHNDVAVAIAEHIGGSVEGFSKMMNQKARDLGAYHTNFVTPNGLDAEGHYTTAVDLANIARYGISLPAFLEITNTPSYSFQTVDKKRSFQVSNKNAFLNQMDGAIGVKTGFTGGAGYCFVGAVKSGNKTFISVVLASGWPPHRTYKWSDTKELMQYGLENYEEREILNESYELEDISVVNGIDCDAEQIEIRSSLSLLLGSEEQVEIEADIPRQLEAPIEKDAIVGQLTVKINGKEYRSIPVFATKSVKRISFSYYLKKVLSGFSI